MSNLIEKLAVQSLVNVGGELIFSKEKFAELIVRECMEVCADRGKDHDSLYSSWAVDCSKRIGKHFGVES